MKIRYSAKITYSKKDKSFLVEFPDLKGCLTEGVNKEEALKNAREALSGYLASVFERGFVIPEPSRHKGDNIYYIEPEQSVAAAIAMRKIRTEKKLNQTECAQRLGISYQAYQRLENPVKSNPTIKTLEKIARIFDMRFTSEFV